MLPTRRWAAVANPYVILVAIIALGGAIAGAYVKGRGDGRAIEFAERATIDEIARVSREAAIESAAKAISQIKVTQTTIRQKAEVITREVPVYRDCLNDPRVVGLLDAARANRAPTEPAGDSGLPGAGADPAPELR